MLSDAIKSFQKSSLKETQTVETSVRSLIGDGGDSLIGDGGDALQWIRTGSGWRQVEVAQGEDAGRINGDSGKEAAQTTRRMTGVAPHQMHGQCYGIEAERNAWSAPVSTYSSDVTARPGYDTMSASEFEDDPAVLTAKVKYLARLVRSAKRCVVYAGAGLSTAAGIDDYATRRRGSDAPTLRSPLCAQPTHAHRVLVAMQRASLLHRFVGQNHDGLAQKAGMPQHAVNEIHGALHAPDNPIVPMSGTLREDLLVDVAACEATSDLVLAVGTSLAGMNADRLVHTANARATRAAVVHPSSSTATADGNGRRRHDAASLGSVIIGLQRTVVDGESTLRIFGTCDDVFRQLAEALEIGDLVPPERPPGTYFCPSVLARHGAVDVDIGDAAAGHVGAATEKDLSSSGGDDRYRLRGLAYDAMGRRRNAKSMGVHGAPTFDLDLRDGARVAIPRGMHAGAIGEVDGTDREGHPRCRFELRLKPNAPLKVPMQMLLGTWWLQAASGASVEYLPVVNVPQESDRTDAAEELRTLCSHY